MPPAVVVIGGHGYFGRLVVDDLLAYTQAHIVVAGRKPHLREGWNPGRISVVTVDQHDKAGLRPVLDGATAVVHAAGPYQRLEPTVLAVALKLGIPYIDLADDREFVQKAENLVTTQPSPVPTVLLGMSFVPGLCAMLVESVRGEMNRIDRVRCIAAPGSRGSRGKATLDSLLSYAGREFDVPRGATSERVCGWSRPIGVEFPPPIGKRTVYIAIPVADFDMFPRWFGCRDVEFRAGSDQRFLNRALWIAAGVQRIMPFDVLRRSGGPMSDFVRVLGRTGTDAAGGMVEVSNAHRTIRVSVTAAERGERLPALPAAIACAELLAGRLPHNVGLVGANRAIATALLVEELARRGVSVAADRGGGWERITN